MPSSDRKLGKLSIAANKYPKQRDYWLGKLSGELKKVYFPYDTNPLPGETEIRLETVVATFPQSLAPRLLKLSNQSDTKLFVVLTAALAALLQRYCGREDLVIGAPVYKQQTQAELLNTVVPLRIDTGGGISFKQLPAEVNRTIKEAMANYIYPIEVLVQQLDISAAGRGFPLLGTAVMLENVHDPKYLRHLALSQVFRFKRCGETLEAAVDYDPALYREETVKGIVRHLFRLLEDLFTDPACPIGEAEVLPDEEKERILYRFNDTGTNFPSGKTISCLFEEQAEQYPHRVAQAYEDRQVTYAQLNREANLLAAVLRRKGGGEGVIAALMVERSLEMMIGIMGILKAGAAYLPLNTVFPPPRIISMMEDCRAPLLLTRASMARDSAYSQWLEGDGSREMLFFESLPEGAPGDAENPAPAHTAESPAYVIFTSGSTGKPKGSLTIQRNVIRVVRDTNYVRFRPEDVVLQLSNYAFDGSVFEIFGALLNGARLIVIDESRGLELDRLPGFMARQQAGVFFITSALFNALMDLDPDCFRYTRKVVVGGEKVSVPHASRALERLRSYRNHGFRRRFCRR